MRNSSHNDLSYLSFVWCVCVCVCGERWREHTCVRVSRCVLVSMSEEREMERLIVNLNLRRAAATASGVRSAERPWCMEVGRSRHAI